MIKKYTCIICPNGCEIKATIEGTDTITSIEGATCKKGEEYVKQELINPQRNIASSVLVKDGILPLASVRLTKSIPKKYIFNVMNEIKKVRLEAPVKINQVAIKNVLNLSSDVIVTKNVGRKN